MKMNNLSQYADNGLLLIRIVLGLMFLLVYGGPKLFGGSAQWLQTGQAVEAFGIHGGFVFWGFLASFIMTFGGLCVLTGLFFRQACFLLFLNLVVAATMHFSKGQGLMMASHAIEVGIFFLGLVFIGPGRFVLHF